MGRNLTRDGFGVYWIVFTRGKGEGEGNGNINAAMAGKDGNGQRRQQHSPKMGEKERGREKGKRDPTNILLN